MDESMLHVKTELHISKPPHEVFEAIVNPGKIEIISSEPRHGDLPLVA